MRSVVTMRRLARGCVASGFAASGVLHFARPEPFRAIVPPGLGDPSLLVAISGAAELAGAAGLLVPATRRAAGIGLVILLAAVFPANVNMAQHAERFASVAPAWALWARLPLQAAIAAAVVFAASRSLRAQAEQPNQTFSI